MADWSSHNITLTTKGASAISKVQAGSGSLTITRVVASEQYVAESMLREVTSLSSENLPLTIIDRHEVQDGGSVIQVQLSNLYLGKAFTLNEIGVFATHSDNPSEEFLYIVAQVDAETGDKIPLYSTTPITATYDIYLYNVGADNIEITISSAGLVTYETLNKACDIIQRNTAYEVGDILHNRSLKKGLAIKCTVAGITKSTDTDLSHKNVGDTVEDGTSQWVVIAPFTTADFDAHNHSLDAHPELVKLLMESSGVNVIKRSHEYAKGDIAYSNKIPSWAFLECIVPGTTSDGWYFPEPSEIKVDDTIVDYTVTWKVRKVADTTEATQTTSGLMSATDKNKLDGMADSKADKTYVDKKIADLVNGAPEQLDTLQELSKALNNDKNYAVTVNNALAEKLGKTEKAVSAKTADSVPWTGVTGKPSTYPPSSHNHDSTYPTKTGTGASGTWDINISGSSASCTGNAKTADSANTLEGIHLSHGGDSTFGKIPLVGDDGLLEIGKHIDFHSKNGDGKDYSARITSNDDGTLSFSGGINANLNGNAASATNATNANKLASEEGSHYVTIDTTDNSWGVIGSNGGYWLKSIRTEEHAPEYSIGNYSSAIAFGGSDTKGIITHDYYSPDVKFAGGSGPTAIWKFTIHGGSNNEVYNLNDFPTKTGTGASGTWGINITGSAGSAKNADTVDGYHASDIINRISAANTGGIVAESLTENGYVKFANGLILQWGKHLPANDGWVSSRVNFPIAFNSACLAVNFCIVLGENKHNIESSLDHSPGLTSFSVYYSADRTRPILWIAIGY